VGATVDAITPAYAGNSGAYGLSMTFGADASVATALIATDPADDTNMVLDINSKTAATSDQLVNGDTWQHSSDYHILNMDLYFTGNDRYKLTATSRGSYTAQVVNFEFAVGNNSSGAGFYANGAKIGTAVPATGRWFNFKIIINQSKPGYDAYVDNVKINDSVIASASTLSPLGTYTNISFGVSKDNGSGGHMYMDNFVMSCSTAAQGEAYEAFAFSEFDYLSQGDKLPVNGSVFQNVPITWACSDEGVTIASDGSVKVAKNCDGKTATVTATVGSTVKEFEVTLSSYEKQLKKEIYRSYSSISVAYTMEDGVVGNAINTLVEQENGNTNDGGYRFNLTYGSDASSTALIAEDPVNSSNKVIDIHSISPGAADQLTNGGTWQHTSEYHFFEMDMYLTGNDRYKFTVNNRNGVAVNLEMGVGNNAGGTGFYVNSAKVGKAVPPTNEWFNFKILIGPNATYDILVNDKKVNDAPIVSNTRNTITAFKFGTVKGYGSGGHMYIDNLRVYRSTYANAALYEKDIMQFPEYVSNGDVLTTTTDIFRLPVTWVCSDANVTIDSDGVVTIPEGCDNQKVTFTANINGAQTKDFVAVLNGYNLHSKYVEDFEYHWLNNKSISAINNWSVVDENRDPNVTHTITNVVKRSDNPANAALAVQVYRVWETYAQLAKYNPSADLSSDYSVYSAKMNLPEVANQYVTYIQGEIENTNGSKTIVNLAQLTFSADGTVGALENANVAGTLFASTQKFPRNQWFGFDVVFDNNNQTFDVYVDNVKYNDTPIKIYGYNAGYSIKSITQVQVGVPRYYWRPATYYIDDITMLSFDGKAASGYDARAITVPSTIENGAALPVTGSYFGSTISWQSSNTGVLNVAADGKVTVTMPDQDTQVTLTATITNNGKSVTKTYNTTVTSDVTRINNLAANLTGYMLTGQKYIVNNFTAAVPGKKDTDVITVSSADTSVISFNGLSATVTKANEDKYVDVTVTITSASGKAASKVVNLYVPSDSHIFAYDGFDYPEYINASVNGKGLWTVENENLDTASSGSTHIMKYSPDDATDQMLDIEVMRGYSSNQLAKYTNSVKVPHKTIMQFNMKFPDSAGNRYLLYVQGTYKNESGATSSNPVAQFYIWRNNGKIECEGVKDSAGNYINITPNGALPTNQWFNVKLELDNLNRTFDLYVDNVKQNTNPVPYYRNVAGEKLVSIDALRLGVSRYSGNPGHMYIDDLLIRVEKDDAAQYEADNLVIPSTFVNDVDLPTAPSVFNNAVITWSSSDEGIVTNDGKLVANYGFGSNDVTLTATSTLDGYVGSKTFNIKAVKTPYFTVDNVVFTASGNDTYTPTSGGTIKNVSVTKYDPKAYGNAKVIVAVYDKDSLVAVSQPTVVSQSETIELNTAIPSSGEQLYAKAFVWNMDNMSPLSYEFRTANELDKKIDIFSIGDSTMQSYGNLADRQNANDMTGWMQVMPLGVDSDYVTINNHGRSGKSTRSFTEQGWINPVWENIDKGDYLIIQFGHNDQKPWVDQDALVNYAPLEQAHFIDGLTLEVPAQFADYKTYEQWLREYVAAARMKGAYPVFATSIRRRQFDENGVVKNSHGGYPEAMIEVAKEINVPVIDLQAKTATWLNDLGVDNSLQYFCASYNGTDNTHLTYKGAVEIANLAIDAMKEIGLPISAYASTIE